MEHWGMISVAEISLLFETGVGSALDKQHIARTIAHELSHMWFGNLVTLKWYIICFITY
jgi:aminopeptidase N